MNNIYNRLLIEMKNLRKKVNIYAVISRKDKCAARRNAETQNNIIMGSFCL